MAKVFQLRSQTQPTYRTLIEKPRVDRFGKHQVIFTEAIKWEDVPPDKVSKNDLVVQTYRNGIAFVPSREDIAMWFEWGKNRKFDYMMTVNNAAFFSCYPVFVESTDFWRVFQEIKRVQFSKHIIECYALYLALDVQLNQSTAWHVPSANLMGH